MRLALRWLGFLVPVVVLCLYLLRSGGPRLPDATAGHGLGAAFLPPAVPTGTKPAGSAPSNSRSQSHDQISAFWQTWSQRILDARPDTHPIALTGTASIGRPPRPDAPRRPYTDYVRNPSGQVEELRLAHKKFVAALETLKNGDHEGPFQGRGVVMVGGGEYFGPAIIGIHMLRRTGCSLPVELFVPDDDEYEEEICEQYLPKLNAKCVVLSAFQRQGGKHARPLSIKHYQLKAPSLLLSSFAEVLLLDSDSIPLLDPETSIFSTEPYLSKGLVIWPDFWSATESPRFWEIAGLPEYPTDLPSHSSESGQLVVNKKTHLAPLLLATYYNIYGDHHYYPLLSQGALGQGDKETFLAAAVALGSPYYTVKTGASSLGRHDGSQHKGTAIIQHLPVDDLRKSTGGSDLVRPAFLHSNTPKMNAGHLVDEGDLIATDGQSRLRLLGPKADLEKLFGFDAEDTLWDLLVQTGCELASTIREWKTRDRLCERLTEHHALVFNDR
ncbi:hypothetical protein JX265_011567 [Neoarthrinium moseri]|uniref:Alpha-1,2-mannosyltransferase n=1 Tax=Neoarthrinium moseri TaxID=1658444 RepID=A0A9P9WC72_9PEZI|nr:uncharacterized protein JN550_011683 [Neoarthrinium moseri]KAI1848579.1 hypothetical protein JX266_005438 [Neoarthrinium moseri]KAI1856608.1 hypothetical protein JX265_011567 [Neoarthrinium moseri]KAI1859999.1 hypothetical protein JN550_011683 [Neoarthrinium moseri]